VIEANLSLSNIRELSFEKLLQMMPLEDPAFRPKFLTWIQFYFASEPGFAAAYMQKLGDSLRFVKPCPKPFFLILFKALVLEQRLPESLLARFLSHCAAAADSISVSFRKCASRLLLQLRTYSETRAFEIKIIHKLALHFVSSQNLSGRIAVFKLLWGDIGFIESLLQGRRLLLPKPVSFYLPLLSLYYQTLVASFLDSNKEMIKQATPTLAVLAATLELFTDSDGAAHVSKFMFPLLSILFTYYDSLKTQLESPVVLFPMILYLIKNCEFKQFLTYWELLPRDGQLRFLDFMIELCEAKQIAEIAKSSPHMSKNHNACAHEVAWRVIRFVTFYDSVEQPNPDTLQRVFKLLIQLLLPEAQVVAVYRVILRAFAIFVGKNHAMLFDTPLLIHVFTGVLPLTQRKLAEARVYGIGFVRWLMQTEKQKRQNMHRCTCALQYAVCACYFKSQNFKPFFDKLPESRSVSALFAALSKARQLTLYHRQILELLDVARVAYRHFASIRAKLYSVVVSINKKNGDFVSAFIMQWRLCALIAEVFKLREEKVDGIPINGFAGFPWVEEEPQIEPNHYGRDSTFLVMESPILKEDYYEKALLKAFRFLTQSSFRVIVTQISNLIFDFLERRRRFDELKDLYNTVAEVYKGMSGRSNEPTIEFSKVAVGDALCDTLGFREAITLTPTKQRRELNPLRSVAGVQVVPKSPTMSLKETGRKMQIVKVHCILKDLLGMRVNSFYKEVVDNPTAGWDEPYVRRWVFQTDLPLPNCVGTVKLERAKNRRVTKHEYYDRQLKALLARLQTLAGGISAVLPRKKMWEKWESCPLNINTKPVLDEMGKVVTAVKGVGEDPCYYFIMQEHAEGREAMADVPEDLRASARDIRQCVKDCIPLLTKVHDLQRPAPEEILSLRACREVFGVPEPAPPAPAPASPPPVHLRTKS
jgi:hypothetical protein